MRVRIFKNAKFRWGFYESRLSTIDMDSFVRDADSRRGSVYGFIAGTARRL